MLRSVTKILIASTLLGLSASVVFGDVFDFGERPLGTEENRRLAAYLAEQAQNMGYAAESLPFTCVRWERGASFLERGGVRVPLYPSPFSPAFDQTLDAAVASTTQQLKRVRGDGRLVFLRDELAKEPLTPRDYPFYFSALHREIYSLVDERRAAAIVAVTGRHPMYDESPFPLFNDANFKTPSGYISQESYAALLDAPRSKIRTVIKSKVYPETGEQWIFRKAAATTPAPGKILIFAHIDTAYNTPGALDNAAGVATLLLVMARLRDYAGPYDLEFVPFNGEDSPMARGEVTYLDRYRKEMPDIRLGINLDALGFRGAKVAVSTYNLDAVDQEYLDQQLSPFANLERGPEWVESDHSIFVFGGVPCLALTSADLANTVMTVAHTPRDTSANVDRALLAEAANFIAQLVTALK